jgi:hypothetical protein
VCTESVLIPSFMPDCMLFRSVIALSFDTFVYASVASWCGVPRLVFNHVSPACSDLKQNSFVCVKSWSSEPRRSVSCMEIKLGLSSLDLDYYFASVCCLPDAPS